MVRKLTRGTTFGGVELFVASVTNLPHRSHGIERHDLKPKLTLINALLARWAAPKRWAKRPTVMKCFTIVGQTINVSQPFPPTYPLLRVCG